MQVNLNDVYLEQSKILENLIPMPQYQSGRSIVTSCYRSELPGTYIMLSELKRLNCCLPIEIFYRQDEINNDEITELTNVWPEMITFKQISSTVADYTDKWGNVKGWGTKVYAILESQYAENLWLDCDNIPVRNCLDLFDDLEYRSKGSLFWRDVYSIDRADQYHSGSDMWRLFQVPFNDGEPFESGQFLLNKPMVWPQLCMMKYYTDNCNIYFSFGGDAECWRMAWQHVSVKQGGYHAQFNYLASNQTPYGFMPYGPFHKGIENPWHKYGGGSVMVQRDRKGKELFNHRNINKWKWVGDNPFNEDVENENNYHMIMNHIKSKYTRRT
jgi:hypothetical protein